MLRAHVGRFLSDRSGNIAVITALTSVVLMGAVAFAVDQGKLFTDRRTAQSVVDLAALAAAGDPAKASLFAARTISDNHIALTAPLVVQTGNYVADPAIPARSRFKQGPVDTADAVRVSLQTSGKTYFSRVIGAPDELPISTTATAATTAIATFSIGSRLGSLDGGVLNQLLGRALGANLTLSLMDYRSLADAKIDTFGFLNAIAGDANITGPTYKSVLDAEVPALDVLGALSKSTRKDTSPAAVKLLGLVIKQVQVTTKISLGKQMRLGPYETLPIGQQPAASADVSALDILAAVARLADGKNQVAAEVDLDLPGVAEVKLEVTIGEPPISSTWATIGRRGAMVETAQTRLFLDVRIAQLGASPLIRLPIYVDIAKAQAQLASVSCPTRQKSGSAALDVTPGIVDAWIADIPVQNWQSMSAVSSPKPATLASLALLKVTGRAHVRMANNSPDRVTFSKAEIAQGKVKTVTTRDYLSSLLGGLLGGLLGDLHIGVAAGSIGIVLPGQAKLIKDAIGKVAAPLDTALYTVLTYLGVGLGEVDVQVQNIRCDVAVLVD